MLAEATKNSILNAMLGKSQYASIASNCYIGLLLGEPTFTTEPTLGEDGKTVIPTGTMFFDEPSTDAGYARSLVGTYNQASSQLMGSPADGESTNTSAIFFPEAQSSWGTVTYFGLFSAQTGGTPFLWGELSQGVTIPANYIPLFRTGSLTVKLT